MAYDNTYHRSSFDQSITNCLGPNCSINDFPNPEDLTPDSAYYDDDSIMDDSDEGTVEIMLTPEAGDSYISAEVMLPKGSTMSNLLLTKRKRDDNGNLTGHANDNPILDTREYIVEFDDGDVTELNANLIAKSMYAQCNPDGNQYVLLGNIIDFHHDHTAITHDGQTTVRADGWTYMKRSTIGWHLCCQWKDGSMSWENLSDLKSLHPVETAEFAKLWGIDGEPAFNWWVPHVLKKRDRIISLVKKRHPRYLKQTHILAWMLHGQSVRLGLYSDPWIEELALFQKFSRNFFLDLGFSFFLYPYSHIRTKSASLLGLSDGRY